MDVVSSISFLLIQSSYNIFSQRKLFLCLWDRKGFLPFHSMKLKRNPTQFTKRLQANLKVKWFRIVLNVKTIHSIRLIKTVSHTIFLNVIGGSASECNKTLEHSGIFLKSTGNLIKFQFCFGHFNAFDKCCRRKLDQSPSFYS